MLCLDRNIEFERETQVHIYNSINNTLTRIKNFRGFRIFDFLLDIVSFYLLSARLTREFKALYNQVLEVSSVIPTLEAENMHDKLFTHISRIADFYEMLESSKYSFVYFFHVKTMKKQVRLGGLILQILEENMVYPMSKIA